MKIVICSGGFDPLTEAHVAYFEAAKALGDKLFVGCNSDKWLVRKKGHAFMPFSTRSKVVAALRCVDEVFAFNDDDDSSCALIYNIQHKYPEAEIIFANGGDRTKFNIPEMVCTDVEFVFGVGGETKANSSSWILAKYEDFVKRKLQPITERSWGRYEVLQDLNKVKVKLLEVEPGQSLSYQRHQFRREFWIAYSGVATVNKGGELLTLNPGDTIMINKNQWHQLINKTDDKIVVFEVQFGELCEESDIERA